MVTVSGEGKKMLKDAERRSSALRTLKADFEERARIAFAREAEEKREDLAETVAALLDEGVPKTQIAAACGYKNYYVSLKDIDARAQKYRGIDTTARTEPSVPEEQGGALTWAILEQGEWSEPNQWGEQEISLEMEVSDVRATVFVTKDENGMLISYVDIAENPSVSVADVKALKNEILGALSD